MGRILVSVFVLVVLDCTLTLIVSVSKVVSMLNHKFEVDKAVLARLRLVIFVKKSDVF